VPLTVEVRGGKPAMRGGTRLLVRLSGQRATAIVVVLVRLSVAVVVVALVRFSVGVPSQ
jgi:hypothetical protein